MYYNDKGERSVTDYKQLAWKYLKYNKKRTILTILGVALSVMILFAFINSVLSYYVTERSMVRKEIKYEAGFLCPSEEVAKCIAEEDCIIEWEIVSDIQGGSNGCSIQVNFKQPFLMKHFISRIEEKYAVETRLSPLASFYFAQDKDNAMVVLALFALLIAYIFAIFGVAVVRNSIQLITLEQIKDYGMLRCMGSTKGQLRSMVFVMGFLLESMGIIVGVLLGFLAYLPIALRAKWEVGFHVIGIPLILLCFMFDLYFVMQENCKFVNKLTPVAAVRGEFKIKVAKIKVRRKSLLGLLFGIEGDYAYKNLRRNPARMWKSVGAMSMGIAMVIVAVSLGGAFLSYMTKDSAQFGKYQFLDAVPIEPGFGQRRYDSILLPQEQKEILQKHKQVKNSKPVYEVCIYTADVFEVYEHYTNEFKQGTDIGEIKEKLKESYLKNKEKENLIGQYAYSELLVKNSLVGYDEEDYKKLESQLVEGTLNISDRGIVLVNQTCAMKSSGETLNASWGIYDITDYRVGDTITFVDFKKLDILMKKRIREKEWDIEQGEVDFKLTWEVIGECYEELVKEGATKTYIIEGIVAKDENRAILSGDLRFVLPQERYWEETGLTRAETSGTMYHIGGYRLPEELQPVYDWVNQNGDYYNQVFYLDTLSFMGSLRDLLTGATIFILFVVIVNMLNVVNTTASDLYLRRKEFAQLRVLGMSKKKLIFTVLLEGIFTSILSGVIGVTLGYLIVEYAIDIISMGYYIPFQFSWRLSFLLVAVSTLIMCATVYLPIRGMDINMAEALQSSGE